MGRHSSDIVNRRFPLSVIQWQPLEYATHRLSALDRHIVHFVARSVECDDTLSILIDAVLSIVKCRLLVEHLSPILCVNGSKRDYVFRQR